MSVADLKKSIIEKLKVVDDEELLTTVNRWLEVNREFDLEEDKDVYILNEEQLKAVSEGQAEYKAGKGIPNHEVSQEFKKWLGK